MRRRLEGRRLCGSRVEVDLLARTPLPPPERRTIPPPEKRAEEEGTMTNALAERDREDVAAAASLES
jgi:hypothetical protein